MSDAYILTINEHAVCACICMTINEHAAYALRSGEVPVTLYFVSIKVERNVVH